MTDPSATELSGRYKAIAIIDSDNDAVPSEEAQKIADPTDEQKLRDKIARPNSVTFYPLHLNTDTGGKLFWEIVGYSDFETGALYALNALSLPDDSIVERYTETEGNHSVVDTVDLTIDTAFITDSDEPVTDIWTYEHMEIPHKNYVSGDAINVNYFVSNRSSIMLDEEYTGGGELKIGYEVSRDADGVIAAEGEDIFTLPLYPRVEMGQMIRLDGYAWCAGDYTVRLTLNPDRAVKEAYYLNNEDFYCRFTVIEALLGDANLDGDVDVTDATAIQRYDAEMIRLSDAALTLADVDRDGEVTIIDATWIQRYAAGMKAPDHIGEPIEDETV